MPKTEEPKEKRTRTLKPMMVAEVMMSTEPGKDGGNRPGLDLRVVHVETKEIPCDKWLKENAVEGVVYTTLRELGTCTMKRVVQREVFDNADDLAISTEPGQPPEA